MPYNQSHPTKADFEHAAKLLNANAAVFIERDYWTCWIMEQINAIQQASATSIDNPRCLVRGGIAFYKAYNATDRIYNDLDYLIIRHDLGCTENLEEYAGFDEASRKRSAELSRILFKAKAHYVKDILYPKLLEKCKEQLTEGWSLKTSLDSDPGIAFNYPRELFGLTYSRETTPSWIKIDIDPSSGLHIANTGEYITLKPLVGLVMPHLSLSVTPLVEGPAPTFWNKICAIHSFTYLNEHDFLRKIYSKSTRANDFYDAYNAFKKGMHLTALKEPWHLHDMSLRKRVFYLYGEEGFKNFQLGKLSLIPAKHRLPYLEKLYEKYVHTLTGDKPPFLQIIAGLEELQTILNQTAVS